MLGDFPRVVAALQPWAEISQRLRRSSKLNQYTETTEVAQRKQKTLPPKLYPVRQILLLTHPKVLLP